MDGPGGQDPTAINIIQRMPAELQLSVFKHLDYQSAIRLSQTSRHFHNILHSQEWPVKEKHWFCQEAETFSRNIDYGHAKLIFSTPSDTNFDIMIDLITTERVKFYWRYCFTVKAAEEFSVSQIAAGWFMGHLRDSFDNETVKRCCLNCSIERGVFRHGLPVRTAMTTTASLYLHFQEAVKWIEIAKIKIQKSKMMKFCNECQALHNAEDWYALGCTTKPPSNQKIKNMKPQSKSLSLKLMKQTLDFKIQPTNRSCGVCGATEPDFPLGDFYCPKCVVWVCWFCFLRRDGRVKAQCGPNGELHDLNDDSRMFEIHQMLMAAQEHPDLPEADLEGAGDHMLADVGFMR